MLQQDYSEVSEQVGRHFWFYRRVAALSEILRNLERLVHATGCQTYHLVESIRARPAAAA